jgi:DNA-binding NtrC family response regulator
MNAFVSDDHQPTRDRVSRLLEAEGFTVRRFPTADSAAAALSEPGCAVDLVLTCRCRATWTGWTSPPCSRSPGRTYRSW